MDLSKLLSPPASNVHDQFSPISQPRTPKRASSPPARLSKDDMRPPPPLGSQVPSPPETPANRPMSQYGQSPSTVTSPVAISVMGDDLNRDPVLFSHVPESESGAMVTVDAPLFPVERPPPSDRIDLGLDALVSQHMAKQKALFRCVNHKPTRDEYLLALSVVPIVAQRYNESPRRWLEQERRILDERFGGANRVWKRGPVTGLAKIAPAPLSVSKKLATPRGTIKTPRAPRTHRVSKPTVPRKIVDPDSPKRVVAPSREDVDFASLPDYAPPTSTLPANNPKALKADWRGQMLDLSHDPNRHLLHPAELHLASTLRLSCATYLCSKRRIFMSRLDALRIGKEFRKTDSQQACKIDVNKASKLWSAYDRVGWFLPEHFWGHLQLLRSS